MCAPKYLKSSSHLQTVWNVCVPTVFFFFFFFLKRLLFEFDANSNFEQFLTSITRHRELGRYDFSTKYQHMRVDAFDWFVLMWRVGSVWDLICQFLMSANVSLNQKSLVGSNHIQFCVNYINAPHRMIFGNWSIFLPLKFQFGTDSQRPFKMTHWPVASLLNTRHILRFIYGWSIYQLLFSVCVWFVEFAQNLSLSSMRISIFAIL